MLCATAQTTIPDYNSRPTIPDLQFQTIADSEDFKDFNDNEYMPLIEHHEDCETEEETDKATGEVTKTVTKCCEACKCIFSKGGEGDEDEEE